MSKLLSHESLMNTLPVVLKTDVEKVALSSASAKELLKLIQDNDELAVYSRIDELDEPLLDILAYCFKIDWWDDNFTIDEKRATLKNCRAIKRRLGTPYACSLALISLSQNAVIREWWQYGGNPYYYKICIFVGDESFDYEKVQRILEGVRFYKNKRSVLEGIELKFEKAAKLYTGVAVRSHTHNTYDCNVPDIFRQTFLTDNSGAVLTDENGVWLTK